ncbi:MAG: hypothetical protein EA416_13435 [Trueperaceae bacterium]|nr:MAG: hypothetical protein EA416_13435 [Trueperaceae bacterium]
MHERPELHGDEVGVAVDRVGLAVVGDLLEHGREAGVAARVDEVARRSAGRLREHLPEERWLGETEGEVGSTDLEDPGLGSDRVLRCGLANAVRQVGEALGDDVVQQVVLVREVAVRCRRRDAGGSAGVGK